MPAERRRAKPGEVIQGDELPPTMKQNYEAGIITEAEYAEWRAFEDVYRTLPVERRRDRVVTMGELKRDPRFQSRLAHHAGITRTVRPLAAAREHRASPSASSRGGDSGDDDSGEPEPGPGSGHLDLDAWLVDRRRVLAALIAGWRA